MIHAMSWPIFNNFKTFSQISCDINDFILPYEPDDVIQNGRWNPAISCDTASVEADFLLIFYILVLQSDAKAARFWNCLWKSMFRKPRECVYVFLENEISDQVTESCAIYGLSTGYVDLTPVVLVPIHAVLLALMTAKFPSQRPEYRK